MRKLDSQKESMIFQIQINSTQTQQELRLILHKLKRKQGNSSIKKKSIIFQIQINSTQTQ